MLGRVRAAGWAAALVCAAWICGCSPYGPEELDRLVKEDPLFGKMVHSRDEARHQIRSIRQEMLSRKQTLDAEVRRLRDQYDAYVKGQNRKIEQYQQTIDTNRNILQNEVETQSALLEAKETELRNHQRTLSDVQKVLKESQSIRLTDSEKQKWQERVLLLSEKVRPLAEEIEELRAAIRLKKRKIGYLR